MVVLGKCRKTLLEKDEKIKALEGQLKGMTLDLNNKKNEIANLEAELDSVRLEAGLDSANYQEWKEGFLKEKETLFGFIVQLLTEPNQSAEALYHLLSGFYDEEGFRLYGKAKEITGIDVYRSFPTEDNLGYFEESDGFNLLGWIMKEKFGDIEWEPLNPPYEIAGNVSFDGREEEMDNFMEELYKMTIYSFFDTKQKSE